MRRIIAATVALAITLVLPLVAPQTAQAASKKTKVSISVSATKLSQGKFLTIKGKVKPAVAGRTVVLQHKMDGAGWKNEVTLTTAADGSYSSTGQVNKLQNRYYRVYAPKFKKYKKAYSKAIYVRVTAPPAPVQQNASVTITSTGSTTLTAGGNFVVNGTASANLVGKTVVLELGGSSGWSDLTSATVAADSTFSLSAPATQAGSGQVLKVYAPATSTTYYAESGTASFTVYGWYYLSERGIVEGGGWNLTTATINGQTYGKSVVDPWTGTSPESVQFDLARKCVTFATTIGWTDSSVSAASGNAAVYKDSVQAWKNPTSLNFGSATPISIDISGALRLKLEAQRTNSSSSVHLAFGDARILCAF